MGTSIEERIMAAIHEKGPLTWWELKNELGVSDEELDDIPGYLEETGRLRLGPAGYELPGHDNK